MNFFASFQRTIATSKFTLPVVVLLSAVAWFLSDGGQAHSSYDDYGLWRLLPEVVKTGALSVVLSFVLSMMAVYFMTELNNTFVLLRISSRMLGSMLAVLLALSPFFHSLTPAHVLLVLLLLSLFPLFLSYQQQGSMAYIFVAYMLLSVASLLFPKILLALPCYWSAQIALRSFNPRTLAASLIGVVVPYWIAFSLAYVNDCLPEFFFGFIDGFGFSLPDYSVWTMSQLLMALYTLLLALVGVFDFYAHGNQDKTRTRVYLNVVVMFAVVSFLLLVWETSHFVLFYPLVLITTSVLAGHHIAQSYSRFDNIYTLVVCLLALALIVFETLV